MPTQRGAGRRAPGALPLQSTHQAAEAAKRAAAADVSEELRQLAREVSNDGEAGAEQSPRPSEMAKRARARGAIRSAPAGRGRPLTRRQGGGRGDDSSSPTTVRRRIQLLEQHDATPATQARPCCS